MKNQKRGGEESLSWSVIKTKERRFSLLEVVGIFSFFRGGGGEEKGGGNGFASLGADREEELEQCRFRTPCDGLAKGADGKAKKEGVHANSIFTLKGEERCVIRFPLYAWTLNRQNSGVWERGRGAILGFDAIIWNTERKWEECSPPLSPAIDAVGRDKREGERRKKKRQGEREG